MSAIDDTMSVGDRISSSVSMSRIQERRGEGMRVALGTQEEVAVKVCDGIACRLSKFIRVAGRRRSFELI